MRTVLSAAMIAACLPVAAQPRFMTAVNLGSSPACNTPPPGPFMADGDSPNEVGFSGAACVAANGQTVVNAEARSGRGLVGIVAANRWTGAGSPPSISLNTSARHEFDVTFSSPTSDALRVRMNLRLAGSINEIEQQFLCVTVTAGRLPGTLFSGILCQNDRATGPITDATGLFGGFSEQSVLQVSTPEISVPANTPVRFALTINSGGPPYAEGGSVNFAGGLQLDSVPFLITDPGGMNTVGDIVIDSPDADIFDNQYGGDTGLDPCPADTNGDGTVTPADFNTWILAFNNQTSACDQNGDGLCTPADFNAWILNFNAGC